MLPLPRPPYTAAEVYQACISRIRDDPKRVRLKSALSDVIDADMRYQQAAEESKLHEEQAENYKLANLTDAEMVAVYDQRMVPASSPGRVFYDSLILSASGICRLCGHRDVNSLDHHMPKKQFPSLAVSPRNLIPACFACNKKKGEQTAPVASKQTINPYFDFIGERLWLEAQIIHTIPAAATFAIAPPSDWSELFADRVRNHFALFDLNSLYSFAASGEIVEHRHELSLAFQMGGSSQVRELLERRAESLLRTSGNWWKKALYSALATDSWYHTYGHG